MKSGELFGADSTAANLVGVAANAKITRLSRWRAAIQVASVSIAAMAASVALAATTTVSVLIDSDNNVGTGCTISTANGPFAGVDRVLNTLVVSDTSGYRITSITMQSCVGISLNAPTLFDSSSTPLARGNGVNGTTAVETYMPSLYLPALGQKMRVGITTTGADGLVGTDALTLTAGGPILVDGPPLLVIPTLAKMSLALTALLLALSVWFARRRGWHGLQMVFVAAFALSISGQLIAAIVRDGFVVDWQGIPAAAVDPAGDSPAGTDITNLYSTVENGNVFFRVDTVLNAPPAANAQSVIAVVGQSVPITLTGSDYEASPLTFTVVTPPLQGVLAGTAPNLTYTPNANATSSDSFTFKANDGLLDSAPATVSIDIKRPPTITSANSTVFIPGQANSFNFTATGVPPATFALSVCAPALPASISFTNNGNNTATLAGNPTVGQGGTYVCTLTASNGFGANATQPFTLNVGLPPTFTSTANTTFTVGTAGSFTVTTTATPATTGITQAGALPSGVTFVYNGPGTPLTGTLAGTPAAGTGGTYPFTLTAANGIPPNTVQNFILTVNQTPAVTSANNTTCTVGVVCTFTVTANGFPVPAIGRSGALPTGMTYVDNGNGTGTLSGTPALGTVASYPLTFTPSNGVGAPVAQSFTLTVAKANQTISYTSTAPVAASVGGPTYTVTATASSTLAPAFTVDPTAAAVCSIAGSTVSFIGVGTCVINANQPGNADFNAAPQVQQSFAVVKGNQTISFTSTAPAAAKVAGPTYTVTATASPSGLPVTFAIDAAATSVCSISGATVSFLTVGTCVINANQAGNASYNAAAQAQQSFTVAKGDQTISFTSTAPVAAKVAGPTYTVSATAAPSGLPVVFTIDASATSVCSIAGSTVSFIGVGTCVVNANQAGNTNYNAAPQVQQSFAVAKGDQTISFTSTAPVAASVAGPTYTVSAAAAPSGLAVVLTIDASATSVCSISGSTVSLTGVGTCVINANQPGNSNYNAAPQVQQSFAVAKGSQTISFTSTAPVAVTVAGPTYTVTATATSGLAPVLTIDATATAVCSIAGSTVSFIGAGTCVINANQPGNANYNAAAQVQQSFLVAKGSQTISFTSTAPVAASVGGATYTVTATASSSLVPAFSIDPSAVAVCTVAGSVVSFTGVGTCVINANQAGNANYNAAPQVQQSFAVAKGSQTISYTSPAPVAASVAGPSYTVTATAAPSGLAVTFTIDATATAVCSIAGSTVSFISVGTCVINANQAGNANYNAATQVQQSFAVAKGNQTISYTSTAPVAASVAGPTYTVTATAAPSGLPVAFTIDATATAVCSIAGSTVSFIGAGTCVINANQAGNTNYNAATQVQQSFAVAKGNQTISYTSTAPVAASVAGPSYTVTATATSGLAPVFTIDATATTVCSIAGSTVTFVGAGTCLINANQPGNANYNAAAQVQQSFAVAKANQTISFTSTAPVSAAVGGATYTVTGSATSSLTVVFTIDATATSVCSIAGATVSFIGAGTCVINANQPGNANYNAASQVQQSFAVAKGNQTISFTSTAPVSAAPGGPTYTVTATATSGLAVVFTIDPTAAAVCSISGATVSFTTPGTCVINANQAGNVNYNAAPQVQQSFTVSKLNQTISYTSTAPVAASVAGPTYTVTATATSGLAPVFTIDATATAVCSIAGSTVSFIGVGTCVINANEAGNGTYFPAPQVQQSFAVAKGNQTISFTSTAPTSATNGGATYTVAATATSGLTVTFATATPSICTVSGVTVSFVGAGTCTINANQAGNANFNAAPQVQQSFSVFQAPAITSANAVNFTSTQPGTFTVNTTGFPTGASMVISQTGALPSGVTFVNNNNGTATLAGTPAAGTQGTWPIVITANNGIAPNATQNFTLTVLNLAPQVIASPKETFDTVGNTQLEFRGAATLPVGFFVSGNLVANFTDADGPVALTAVPVVGGATTNGGTVNIAANGEFLYTPKAGDTAATDNFLYQITDSISTATRTVVINRVGRIVYVKNNFGSAGSGRSHEPYNTLAPAVAASVAGDTIYVYNGDNTNTNQNTGVVLKNNQRLIGQGVALTAPGTVNGAVNPQLVAAGTHAKIGNGAGTGVDVNEVTGVTIRGVEIASTGAGSFGLHVHTLAGASNASAVISDNRFTAASAAAAIRADQNSLGTTTLAIDNNLIAGGTVGFGIQVASGTGYITSFQNNSVTQPTGSGGAISGFTFDATPGGVYDAVSCGTLQAGSAALPLSGSGFQFNSVKGDLSCADVLIANSAGTGLVASSTNNFNAAAGTGFRFTVAAGGANRRIDSTGNVAVSINGADISLPLTFVGSTNSAGSGISLVNARGGVGSTAFSATSGAITRAGGATGNAFNVDGGTGNVTYPGAITSSSNKSVNIVNRTGDTVSLSGAIADTGTGLNMTNNTGATINFTGGINASTGANAAFTATGGGTVSATQNNTSIVNTLTTTTGTALNVANTAFGASGFTVRSINTSGASTGILLTSTSGNVSVVGDGTGRANGSGGSLSNSTFAAMTVLTSSGTVSLNSMNFSITILADHGILFDNNAGGTLVGNITGCTFTGAGPINGVGTANISQNKSMLQFEAGNTGGGAANVTANVQNSFFFNNRTYGMYATAAGDAIMNVTLNQSGFGTDTNTGAPVNNPGTIITNPPPFSLAITNGSNAKVDYNVTNNTFWGARGLEGAIYAVAISGASTVATSHLNGTFSGNKIGKAGVLSSGCANGCAGLGLLPGTGGAFNPTVTNNDIRQVNSIGINFQNTVGAGATFTSSAKFKGNTLAEPDTTGSPLFQRALQVSPINSGGASTTVCAEIGGTGAGEPNIMSGPWPGGDIRLSNLANTIALRLPSYGGVATDTIAVNAFVSGRNGGAATNSTAGPNGFVGGAPCP